MSENIKLTTDVEVIGGIIRVSRDDVFGWIEIYNNKTDLIEDNPSYSMLLMRDELHNLKQAIETVENGRHSEPIPVYDARDNHDK